MRENMWRMLNLLLFPVRLRPNRSVVLVPEDPEDMWHAYNLIAEGDQVRSSTIRKVCRNDQVSVAYMKATL